LYNYITLDLEQAGGFSWARGIPPGAWYVPSVIPGNSAVRIGYPPETYVPRESGAIYNQQWSAALDTGVEPAMVTITSFNEWHEGSQIEPAAVGVTNGKGYTYKDYGPLPPEGYLELTREWVDRLSKTTWPEAYPIRIRLVTTSDWTTFGLVEGGNWLRPSTVSESPEANDAWLEGDRLLLTQSLSLAESGGEVEMVIDILLTGLDTVETLVFEIERGHLGSTQAEIHIFSGDDPVLVETLTWAGIVSGERNAVTFQVPAAKLLP
jgi:hypothetical protein